MEAHTESRGIVVGTPVCVEPIYFILLVVKVKSVQWFYIVINEIYKSCTTKLLQMSGQEFLNSMFGQGSVLYLL